MRPSLLKKSGFLLLLLCFVVASATIVYFLFTVGNTTAIRQQASSIVPTPTLPPTPAPTSTSQAQATTTPVAKQCSLKQRDFQMGISFPQWNQDAYGGNDIKWHTEMPQMHAQTAACWVEMPVLFYQAGPTSTVVTQGPSTPSIASLSYGIQYARALGLHVFVTALLQVGGSQPWAGTIQFSTYAQEQAWFNDYWQTLQPYVVAAAGAGAEQFAIGTEEEWLQQYAPDALWDDLINNFHSVFPGKLTYDMNWTSLQKAPRAWMNNPNLNMIGVSAYLPIAETATPVDPQLVANLWATKVKSALDNFATQLGAPIFISEIGYRNTSDALYQPWVSTSSAPVDLVIQAQACEASLQNVLTDPQILGMFFWGWDDVGAFQLNGSQAASVIYKYYTSLQA